MITVLAKSKKRDHSDPIKIELLLRENNIISVFTHDGEHPYHTNYKNLIEDWYIIEITDVIYIDGLNCVKDDSLLCTKLKREIRNNKINLILA